MVVDPSNRAGVPDRDCPRLADAGRLLLIGPAAGPMLSAAEQARKVGWDVRSADDGFSAIEAVVRDAQLEAVLLDLEAFQPRSAELAATLESARPGLPIYLLCPAWMEPEARRLTRSNPAMHYLIAPLDPADVHEIRSRRPRSAPPSSSPAGTGNAGSTGSQSEPGPALIELGEVLARLQGRTESLLPAAARWVSAALGGLGVRVRWLAKSADFKFPPGTPGQHGQPGQLGQPELPPATNSELPLLGADGTPAGGLVVAGQPGEADALGPVVRLLGRVLIMHQRMATLQQMAFTDHLSGAFNRRYLMSFLDRLIGRAQREHFRITLAMFDIDDLKKYNDTFGHAVGDEIITDVARLMKQTSRPHDVVARIGGDEFAVLFWDSGPPRQPGSQHPHEAQAFAERFRKVLAAHRLRSLGPSAHGTLTMSGGLARYPDDGRDALTLLAVAGQGLKFAKTSGKNRIYIVGQEPENK